MFAGIVEAIGEVVRVGTAPRRDSASTEAYRLEVRLDGLLDDLRPGASVAINGVCLTLTEQGGGVAGFDVIPETWRNTTLRWLAAGDLVNAERALRVGDRIDGHLVQGHVDGVGRVERVQRAGGEWKLWIATDAALMPYLVRKGAVAVDGTSLTIVDAGGTSFSVALIPTTLQQTVLGRRQPGDRVNIETDLVARLVISRLADLGLGSTPPNPPAEVTFDRLREGGFL